MAEITYFTKRAVSEEVVLARIVAVARADGGLWLMVKERAMEARAMAAELDRQKVAASETGRSFAKRLTPTLAELTDELVSLMFGSCPPTTLAQAQAALLQAANAELDGKPVQPT